MDEPGNQEQQPFTVEAGDPGSSVLIHVPHSSTRVPEWVRQHLVLSDTSIARELALMTDARTDEIANEAAGLSRLRPWLFVNELSRLVVDPERFPDPAHELMAAPEIGMGAVYTRTAHGDVLRHPDAVHSHALIDTYFTPYADGLTSLVAQRLQNTGGVTIIDLHSYPLVELPYERHVHPDAPRPACCIGTDPQHTLPALAAAVAMAFARLGETAVNEPFAGTYVPLAYFGSDPRVQSVMVELRRDTYLEDPQGIDRVARMLASLVDAIDDQQGGQH